MGNSNDNVELGLNIISELKKHNINTVNLNNAKNKIEDIKLKSKIEDITSIYTAYEEWIKDKYIDEEDILTKLNNKLEKSTMFNNSYVYIDEFSGFTDQEYEIITKIMKKAEKLTVSFCTDSLEQNGGPETDVFYTNKQVIKRITECAKKAEVKIQEPIHMKKTYRFKNKELQHLEENLYKIKYKKFAEECSNIQIFLANNPYSELEQVCKTIINLVKNEGIKYSDISIITKNIDETNNIAKAISSKYNIPIFIDEKNEVTQNILIKYILSMLEIFTKNWSNEAVFNYIKSGFLNIQKQEIYKLENYCTKWGIQRNKWYKQDWNYEDFNNISTKAMNELRKQIVNPLIEFKNSLTNSKTAKEITIQIYEFLQKNNIPDKIEQKAEKLRDIEEQIIAEEYEASIGVLYDVLDEIVTFFGEEKITFNKYEEILKVGLSYKEFGRIPQAMDQVVIGDIDRSRSHKVKAVFIIGLNDGVFPSINKNEGFLNDNDRENLKLFGIETAKGSLEALYENQFNIYKAFTTAEEKLFLSYPSSNKEGKALRPSILISKIKKIFINIKESSDIIARETSITTDKATFDELLFNIRNLENGEQIDKIWYEVYDWYNSNNKWKKRLQNSLKGLEYKNISGKISKENIEKLYGKTLKTSISKLEQYKKCPFSFYLKYGLKLQDKDEFKIKAIDTGSFMHEVIDSFFNQINVKEIETPEIEKIIIKIIEEKLMLKKNYIFTSTPKFIVLTKRLKKVIAESVKYIVEQMKASEFEVLGNEVEFTKKIENVEITGKIDRIDIAENAEGQFIRIIDYKSSTKDINLNEMLAGTQIQLLTYMDILSEKENKIPAGMLYFNLINPIIQNNKNLSNEQIEEKIKQKFKMKGLILADINIIKMMDKKLEKGASENIPVYIDKEGNISKTRSSTVTKEEFIKLQQTIRTLIKQISNEIQSGKIDINPVYDSKTKTNACKYCQYKTICNFNTKMNTYRYIKNKTKEEILEKL